MLRSSFKLPRHASTLLLGLIFLVAVLSAPQSVQGAAFVIPCGDSAALIFAIDQANDEATYPGADTITLAAGCTYILTAVNPNGGFNSPTGLPRIISTITINGNGATIMRAAASPDFRIMSVGMNDQLVLNNVILTGGRANSADPTESGGGGVYSDQGNVTLINTTLSGNSATREGGGLYNFAGSVRIINSTISGNTSPRGGGFSSVFGTVSMTNTEVSGNSATNEAGGIYSEYDVATITGSTISGNTANVAGGLISAGTMTLNRSTVSNNTANQDAGGIMCRIMITLNNSVVTGNSAGDGAGGLWNSGCQMTLNSSTVSNNSAATDGGGLVNTDVSTITLNNSTISGNTAANWGGGIMNYLGDLVVSNSTISGNTANNGGGSYITGGIVRFVSSTISGNTAPVGSGLVNAGLATTLGSTIVAPDALNGAYTDAGGNLIGGAPQLGALADNGGVTLTMLPQAGSPVIDVVACQLNRDQRGISRPQPTGGRCDIGAVEVAVRSTAFQQSTPALCADLNGETNAIIRARIPANTITNGSVFCRIIAENSQFREDAAEIGITEVINQGVIQAVDVFGLLHDGVSQPHFNLPVTVCLQGSGRLFYLDATAAPRTVVELAGFAEGDYTCADIPNAGTVVLVVGTANPANMQPMTLTGCMVTTGQGMMNLRATPDTNSTVLTKVPYNVTLTALQRQGDWFYVDDLGTMGWLNAAYVTQNGSCEA